MPSLPRGIPERAGNRLDAFDAGPSSALVGRIAGIVCKRSSLLLAWSQCCDLSVARRKQLAKAVCEFVTYVHYVIAYSAVDTDSCETIRADNSAFVDQTIILAASAAFFN